MNFTTKHKLKTDYGILLLLIFSFSLLIFLHFKSPLLIWDENVYLSNARSHISASHFTEDFRYPAVECLIAFGWAFTGESVLSARLIMILISTGFVLISYLCFKQHLKRLAIIATILLVLNPLFVLWGFRIYTEMLTLLFIMSAYYLLGKKDHNFLAGALSALAFLSRFPAMLFPVSVGLFFLFKRKYKPLISFCLGFAIALSPWLVFNLITYGNPIWDVLEYWKDVNQFTPIQPVIKQVLNFVHMLGLLILMLPLGIYNILKHRLKGYKLMFIYLAISLTYYFFVVHMKLMRYDLMVLPFLLILCFQGLELFPDKLKKWIIASMAISVIILFSSQVSTILAADKCASNGAIEQSIDYIHTRTHAGDALISNFWPWDGYYNNLEAHPPWSNDIDMLIETYKPKYFLQNNQKGIEFNQELLLNHTQLVLEKNLTDSCKQSVLIFKVNYSDFRHI